MNNFHKSFTSEEIEQAKNINILEYIASCFSIIMGSMYIKIIDNIKLVNGPAKAIIIFLSSKLFPFPNFLFKSFIFVFNFIDNPYGVIYIFSGFNFNASPAIKCPNS